MKRTLLFGALGALAVVAMAPQRSEAGVSIRFSLGGGRGYYAPYRYHHSPAYASGYVVTYPQTYYYSYPHVRSYPYVYVAPRSHYYPRHYYHRPRYDRRRHPHRR